MEVIGAIDTGTQSTRFYLFDKNTLRPVSVHQVEFPQIYPKAGWCEHDPFIIWDTVQECIAKSLTAAEERFGPVTVKCLGITNQRETTVLWNRRNGQPLHNALVWLDTRTSDICKRMEEELGSKEYFRPVTGLPISTYFSAFKYLWLYENVPEVQAAVDSGEAMFGTVESWLIYMLTGGAGQGIHVTDVTNASRTMLMDLHTCSWHQPFLDLFKVPRDILPEIVSNAELYGSIASGPLAGVPITGCLGDQMSAMLGQRCEMGDAKNTYGTGCFMMLNTGPTPIISKHGLLTTLAFQLGPATKPEYALEGSVAVGGLGISWLRDKLGVIESAAESEKLAAEVPDSGGVYFVPAFSGLLAPHWQDTARGIIVGLTGFSTRAHICRAMLEAICFQSREVLDAMRVDCSQDEAVALAGLRSLRVDGGATSNDLLMQLQADILQVPVVRPGFPETTSLGAALAAGLGAGLWERDFIFDSASRYDDITFTPKIESPLAERRYGHWRKAVSRSLDLADLAT